MSFTQWSRPDWVILGVRQDADHVYIVASRRLRSADMEVHPAYEDLLFDPIDQWTLHKPNKITLSVVMDDYVHIMAPSYDHAFAKLHDLFKQWDREPSNRPQLVESPREIEA